MPRGLKKLSLTFVVLVLGLVVYSILIGFPAPKGKNVQTFSALDFSTQKPVNRS